MGKVRRRSTSMHFRRSVSAKWPFSAAPCRTCTASPASRAVPVGEIPLPPRRLPRRVPRLSRAVREARCGRRSRGATGRRRPHRRPGRRPGRAVAAPPRVQPPRAAPARAEARRRRRPRRCPRVRRGRVRPCGRTFADGRAATQGGVGRRQEKLAEGWRQRGRRPQSKVRAVLSQKCAPAAPGRTRDRSSSGTSARSRGVSKPCSAYRTCIASP